MEPVPPQQSFESAMDLIRRWKAVPAEEGFISDHGDDENSSEIRRYLQAVKVIIVASKRVPDCQSQAEEALCMAAARLKHEFLNILNKVNTAAAPPDEDVHMSTSVSLTQSSSMSTGSDSGSQEIHAAAPTEDAICDLKSIVHSMNSAGYLDEYIRIYTSARKSFLGTHLKRLGIWKLGPGERRALELSDEFKRQIDLWIDAFKVFYKVLLPRENSLYWQIFSRGEDAYVYKTVNDAKVELMNFAGALINSCRSPDKLFKLLDLYLPLADVCPPLAFVNFSEPITKEVEEAEPILGLSFQLVEVVRGILSNFVNALVHEVSPINETRGTIHFLTNYVIDYIKHVVDYDYILSRFIVSNPPACFGDLTIPDAKFAEHEGQTPLALHLVLIIVVLRYKLEAKSKSYEDDASLVHFFMTNNLHYIIQSIKGLPKLETMIGEEYMNYLSQNCLKHTRASYEKATCERMLRCLKDDEPQRLSKFIFSGVSASTLRRRIKKFTTLFESVRSTQARWMVTDLQLREDLRLSIADNLVPAYKSLLERFTRRVGRGKHPYLDDSEKTCIKYSVEELQASISNDFFALIYVDFFAT